MMTRPSAMMAPVLRGEPEVPSLSSTPRAWIGMIIFQWDEYEFC